ncbi:hypothetical protein JRO89_XSUnG0111600 [Xanthoceras sorbifolium]|uniref:Pectinesterase n=1 Tax=Xanthoceras sorbifolium TaxID=99658 RepID=A0ABQ8GYI0_9ROSI|nr:hypothetical protein JRO89_XSUnG0111600 [Xanthoceras sorbifolium]
MMQFFTKSVLMRSLLLLLVSIGVGRAEDCTFKKGGSDAAAAYTITVDKYPSKGEFGTVQAAIDSVPENNHQWIRIHIKPGIYKEQVQIPRNKQCIILEGEDRTTTKITYNGHEKTDVSATFSSFSDNVIARAITFEALAARIYGDKSAFFDCGFVGVQDTLWDVQGRHYFNNCYIEGAIDFIFGRGQSIFEDCLINSTVSLRLGSVGPSYITAQGRQSKSDPSGFVFVRGQVVGSGDTYLGRAYGLFSRVIFYQTMLSDIVTPSGWNAWNLEGNEDSLFYTEVECKGPGSNTSQRVPWEKKVDASELSQFSKSVFINQDGWLNKLPDLI